MSNFIDSTLTVSVKVTSRVQVKRTSVVEQLRPTRPGYRYAILLFSELYSVILFLFMQKRPAPVS